jgi:membrane-associated protease RseP (regulator of RpoE activity)
MVKGVVVEDHNDRVVFSTYKGEIEILKINIDQIFFDNEEQNYVYMGDKALAGGDFDLAFGFYQKAILINPDFEKARGAFLRLNDAISRKKLGLEPQEFFAKLNEQLGVSVETYNNKIRIKSVKKDSSADKAGMVPGDYITGVWDRSLMFMDPESAAELMVGAAFSSVQLSTEKNVVLPVKPVPWYERMWSFLMFDDFGCRFAMRTQGLVVSFISPDGAAKRSGLKLLDEVTRINGESTRYMPVSMVRTKIFQSHLKKVDLTIKRQIVIMRAAN